MKKSIFKDLRLTHPTALDLAVDKREAEIRAGQRLSHLLDIYKMICASGLGIKFDEVSREQRQAAKSKYWSFMYSTAPIPVPKNLKEIYSEEQYAEILKATGGDEDQLYSVVCNFFRPPK